jgi:hypothetical protein
LIIGHVYRVNEAFEVCDLFGNGIGIGAPGGTAFGGDDKFSLRQQALQIAYG